MLRIAICDDSEDDREILKSLLEKCYISADEDVVYEFSSGKNAVSFLQKHPGEIDLLFLDIEMPNLSGMEAAEAIRAFDASIQLIFVTGYPDYVFDGYRVGAMDYLVKPVKEDRLREVLECIRTLLGYKSRCYCLKNTEGSYRFYYSDISYFYSDKRKIVLVSKGKEIDFYGKLDALETELDDSFVRIHQRYLVNASHVEKIGHSSVMVDGRELPVSRSLKEGAVKKLAAAMMKGL